VTPERAVDAHSEDYVKRYCALDPITATYIGVAGHDHELPDLCPDGFAARVIVDIGMHLELTIPDDNPFGFHPGETWSPALGREFMGLHCQMDPAFIDFGVKRYLGWPGQAPSYKVGERIWLEARDEARARL
jgi:hypothetical protein